MKIRKFRLGDTEEVAGLISKTFKKYCRNDGSKKAVKAYVKNYSLKNIEKLRQKFSESSISYVAEDEGKIIGVIRGDKNRIRNLFVYEKCHGKGIGKNLLIKFEMEAKKLKTKIIRIKSSLYAVPFYQTFGYKKSRGIIKTQNLFGLKYQPMIKKIK